MTEESSGEDGEADASHAEPVGVVRGLIVSLIGAARTRLDLAAVEAEIFLLRSIQMLLWAFAAVACGLLGLAFAVVAVVAALWDTHRMLGVLCGAGLFLVLAGVFGYVAGLLDYLQTTRIPVWTTRPTCHVSPYGIEM